MEQKETFKKIVLAYSGGLDTSIIIPWLKENYGNPEIVAVSADVVQRKHGDKEKYVKENGGKIELFAFVHSSLRWLIGLSEITITKTRPRNLADFASFWLSRAKPRPRRQKRRGAKNASCRFAASQGIGLLRGRCGRMGGR